MTERARTLRIGGALLAVVLIGLVLGFIFLRNNDSASPNPSPTATSTDVKTQVEQAYLRYWDVYADAMLRLDPSRLSDVLADKALANHNQEVQAQRSKNQPVRISVEHDYALTIVDQATVSVEDNYVNHSVRLDPQTKQPVDEDPNQRVRRTYTMKKVDSVWKVTLVIGFRS